MRKILMIYTLIVATFTSCIKNDIPLPVIVPKVTSLEVDGASSVVINSDKRTINITLEEQTDADDSERYQNPLFSTCLRDSALHCVVSGLCV